MTADLRPAAGVDEPGEHRDDDHGPDGDDAGDHDGGDLDQIEGRGGDALSARWGHVLPVLAELGEATPGDHEDGPCPEDEQRTGPEAFGPVHLVPDQPGAGQPLGQAGARRWTGGTAGSDGTRPRCPRSWPRARRRTAHARRAGTNATGAPAQSSGSCRAPGCRRPAPVGSGPRQASRSLVGQGPHRRQGRRQRTPARLGDPVGPPPVVGGQWLDEPPLVEAGDRPVEGPGPEHHPGEGLDVLGQRMPVLRA